MYTSIYYDRNRNDIYLTEVLPDGTTNKIKEKMTWEYYVESTNPNAEYKDIYGRRMERRETEDHWYVKSLFKSGIKSGETQIMPEMKYLYRRYGTGTLMHNSDNLNTAYFDIEVESGDGFPFPEYAEFPINLISVYHTKTKKMHTFTFDTDYNNGHKQPIGADYCDEYRVYGTEAEMLTKFIKFIRRNGTTAVFAWNGRAFDIPYIINRAANLGVQESMSVTKNYILRHDRDTGDDYYDIPGIAILDPMILYKKFVFEMQPSYSLQSIGMAEVGEGKLDTDGAINTLYRTNWGQYVRYNIQDVRLMMKIENKIKHIDLAMALAYSSRIPFDQVTGTLKVVTGDLLGFLKEQKIVIPDRAGITGDEDDEELEGAFVYAESGMFENVVSFDMRSMYPFLGMQFNISPETKVTSANKHLYDASNLISTPIDGLYYRKDIRGVLPMAFERGFNCRDDYKSMMLVRKLMDSGNTTVGGIAEDLKWAHDKSMKVIDKVVADGGTADFYKGQQLVYKIKINSYYGALGNKYFCLYDIQNAAAITAGGQAVIKHLSYEANRFLKIHWSDVAKKLYGLENVQNPTKDPVILIDTDSNYLCLNDLMKSVGFSYERKTTEGLDKLRAWVYDLDKRFFEPYWKHCLDIFAKMYNADNIMYFKREKIITKMIILAKKKYLVNAIDNEGEYYGKEKLSITGIEIVSSSTPTFCKEHLKKSVTLLLDSDNSKPVLDYMRNVKAEFKKLPVHELSKAMGVKQYEKWDMNKGNWTHGPIYAENLPYHVKGSINYNYLVQHFKLPLMPITNGSKVRLVYVNAFNDMNVKLLAFIGNYPDIFKEYFTVDYNKQWEVTFQAIIQRIFDAINWGPIDLHETALSQLEALGIIRYTND